MELDSVHKGPDARAIENLVHEKALEPLHPEDREIVAAVCDEFGVISTRCLTETETQTVRRYKCSAASVRKALTQSMPAPAPPRSIHTAAPAHAQLDELTNEYQCALAACVRAHPDQFDLSLLSGGSVNGLGLCIIMQELLQFLRVYGEAPTWIGLEQIVMDKVGLRHNERVDEIQEVLAAVRATDVEKEMPFLLPRYVQWVKSQQLKRALQSFAEALTGNGEDKTESWENLQKAWSHGKPFLIEDGSSLIASPLEMPREIVKGVLYQGHKLMLGGGSKSYKTFALLDLAVSVATGEEWWGQETSLGRVLYVNYEIDRPFFKDRLKAIVDAKRVSLQPGQIDHVYLRGETRPPEEVLAQLKLRIRGQGYVLAIFDPVYKMLHNRNENAANDIAGLLNQFAAFAEQTGVAVAYANHFSKGNQAGKESMDRVSGSGVFARDPDCIVTLTKHELNDTFVAELTLRNSAPVRPFCVRWNHPLMVIDEDADPSMLKKAGGRPTKHSTQELLKLLKAKPLSTGDWRAQADKELGICRSIFYTMKKSVENSGKVIQMKGEWQLDEEHK
jgi:hypothetical protein